MSMTLSNSTRYHRLRATGIPRDQLLADFHDVRITDKRSRRRTEGNGSRAPWRVGYIPGIGLLGRAALDLARKWHHQDIQNPMTRPAYWLRRYFSMRTIARIAEWI